MYLARHNWRPRGWEAICAVFFRLTFQGAMSTILGGLLGSQPIQNETGEAWGPDISAQVRRKLRLNK